MFKLNRSVLGPALVLISGLVSCADKVEDKTTKDVYRAEAPVIVRGGRATGLRGWMTGGLEKNLDLQDAIDARKSGAASVEVTANCQVGERRTFKKTSFAGSDITPIFGLIPQEILGYELKTQPPLCTFELVLQNTVRSKHVLPVVQATITDSSPAPAGLEFNSAAAGARPRLRVRALNGAVYRSPSPGQAAIVCEDAATPEIPFHAAIPLIVFDYNRMNLYEGRPAEALQAKPEQTCRAVTSVGGNAVSYSPLFTLLLELPPIEGSISYAHPEQGSLQPGISKGGLLLAKATLINRTSAVRRVVIPRGTIRATVLAGEGTGSFYKSPVRTVHIALEATPGTPVVEHPDRHIVTLGPGASVSVAAIHKPGGVLICRNDRNAITPDMHINWFRLTIEDQLTLREISSSEDVLSEVSVPVNRTWYFGIAPALANSRDTNEPSHKKEACNWPY